MTKRRGHRRGYGHGRKNKRTMRRRRSHSAHLTRSRRHHRHGNGSRARRGGGGKGDAVFKYAMKAAEFGHLAYERNKAAEAAEAAKEKRLKGIGKDVNTVSTARMFPGATASSFKPSPFSSRASSRSPQIRRKTAENLQLVPGRLSAVNEDELALLTSNRFARSRLANTGANAASAARDGMSD